MKNFLKLSVIAASATLLVACGGSTSSVPNTSTSQLTGLAAVGSPISSGVLSALDVSGRTASTTIADDGTYSIDFLSTLQRPVLLKAEGVSGGRTAVHFGVITGTTGLTVNVTPVSTAVVAQVMQSDPGVVFSAADTSKIALLTSEQVSATNTIIGNALSEGRNAAGISNSVAIDFLNTPFYANKTGFDKLLDLVKISIQPDRSVHIKNKTADGVAVVSLSGNFTGNLGVVASIDTAGIDLLGKDLENAFRGGWQVNSQSVLDLFSNEFLQEGVGKNTIIQWISEDANDMLGARFLPAKILNCSIVNSLPICEVLFTVKYADGAFEPFIFPVRQESGFWKIYGDQSPVYTAYSPVVYRTVQDGSAVTTRSGFNIQIPDDAAIGDDDIGYVKAWFGTDTSIPPEYVFVNPSIVLESCTGLPNGGFLQILTNPSNIDSCAGNFAELTDGRIDQLRSSFSTLRPKITVRYYDASGNWIANGQHVINVESLPLKPSEVPDGYFATVTAASWNEFAATNLKTPFTLAVTKGASVGLEDVIGAGPLTLNPEEDVAQRLPFSTVRTGSSWRVLKSNNSLITVTRDADGRMYWYQRQELN